MVCSELPMENYSGVLQMENCCAVGRVTELETDNQGGF